MQLIVIAHDIRSTHNVGSIFRTCDGFGVNKIFLTGYTPYPTTAADKRLPHIHQKLTRQIHKSALGAETTVAFEHRDNLASLLQELQQAGYFVCALEQAAGSTMLHDFWRVKCKHQLRKVALLVGNEVTGLTEALDIVDAILEIPMQGKKESFNVAVATGVALYELGKPADSDFRY